MNTSAHETPASLKYLDAVRTVLQHLEDTQLPAIAKATSLVVNALTHGGAVFCAAIGHGNHLDFLNRAGGLAALQLFESTITVNSTVADCLADRPRPRPLEVDLENVRHSLKISNLCPGDVLLLGSVSGKNRAPVELALACRDMGVAVIAFTSMTYTAKVTSLHPSGKKLCDVADVVIDNGAPYGDAAVALPGYEHDVLPVSGVSVLVAGWMLWGSVMEKMAALNKPATVFMSINRDGGPERYNECVEHYKKQGY